MSKEATARLVVQSFNDTGEPAEKTLDETLLLSGFYDITPGRRMYLAASASDTAVTFTDVIGLVLYSHSNPFKLRLADAETQLDNLRMFVVMADDEDDGAHQTSVLLSGNGSTPSDIEIWLIEKPS